MFDKLLSSSSVRVRFVRFSSVLVQVLNHQSCPDDCTSGWCSIHTSIYKIRVHDSSDFEVRFEVRAFIMHGEEKIQKNSDVSSQIILFFI